MKKGDATTFRIVPSTEVFVNGSKGQPRDIRVGVKALVEGGKLIARQARRPPTNPFGTAARRN